MLTNKSFQQNRGGKMGASLTVSASFGPSAMSLAATSSFAAFTPFFPKVSSSIFRPAVPAFAPRAVSIPVTVPLPSCPVPFELAVRYVMVPGRQPAIAWRQIDDWTRDPVRFYVRPWTIIRSGSKPTAFVGAIPVALVE